MSLSEDDIIDAASFNFSPQKQNKKETAPKREVFELFTVKPSPSRTITKSINQNLSPSASQETSELSDDVFVKPKAAAASTPSKSETKSYRDKINERFKNIREKAGKSSKKANVFREIAEKLMLDKIRRESNDIDAEFELMRNRFKLGKSTKADESYDFFCKERQSECDAETVEGDCSKSTDNLTEKEANLKYVYPENMNSTLQLTSQQFLFKAKARPVDIDEKVEDGSPRFLEEEGFYVSKPPNISSRNIFLLEQRLSRDNKKWFNCEGNLDISENPIQKASFRPQLQPVSSSETTVYLPAKIQEAECEEIVIVNENILQLDISTLKFLHHPLFSVEHVFERKLRKLFDEYETSVAKDVLNRLNCRLDALRHFLDRNEETSQSGDQSDREDDKIDAVRREIYNLQEMVLEEGKNERDRIKEILNTWKAIKKNRETNTFSSTSIKLVVLKQKTDFESDKADFEQKFDEFFEVILEQPQEKLPQKQKQQKDDELRNTLLKRFKESFRPPGEPILHFTLTDEHEITKIIENLREITRRNAVSATKIALKIICNKMEVCKTNSIALNQDFTCNFNENISIQLVNIPKTITIEIIEQSKRLIKRTSAILNIKVPPRNVSKNNKKIRSEYFEKNENINYKHSGVGSGIKVESIFNQFGFQVNSEDELNTLGYLTYSLAWDCAKNLTDNEEYDEGDVINKIIDKNGAIDLKILSEWMSTNKPDPQDPRNSILYDFSINSKDDSFSASTNKTYFRLNPYLESLEFCNRNVLDENLRLTLLQLRDKNEPEFDGMMIPNRVKEIPLGILEDYKKRIKGETQKTPETEDEDEDEIQKKRSRGRKILKESQIKVFQKCKNTRNNLTFEDVIDEQFLNYLEKMTKAMANNFLNWFRWRPQNTPLPEGRKASQDSKIPPDFQMTKQTNIVFKIISAMNLPQPNNKSELNSYVEINYNNATIRTSSISGTNPNWNEQLFLPLELLHNDYLNPNSLSGTVVVNIFDEKENTLSKFGGINAKRWLGSLELSLAAICSHQIEGMFKLKIPSLLLGYNEKEYEKDTKSPRTGNLPNTTQQAYINMCITVQPNIPKLSPSIEELPCSEVPYLRDHALKWNENYNANYPERKFSVFAIDTNATTVCIVRYIKPLEPPQIHVEGFDVTAEQCARFISLIPFTQCNQFYQNIWLSVDQFLNLMIGSIVDHAVALTCYLLALKLEAWLLLGFGVPYGSTAFVLVKEYDGNNLPIFCIFDVTQGEKIYLTDVFCPLQRIFCIFNDQNVWANVQRNDNLSIMRFDFTRRSDWLPLFNNNISAPSSSVHGKIVYTPIIQVDQLEIMLDRKIRKQIAKLRQLDRTIWNHQVSNVLKSILHSFEDHLMYGKSNQEMLQKLQDCTTTYEIEGHVYNSPFTNVSSLIKRVKSFGLHLEENQDVQFASAVFMKSYPNQVLTVWVFLASVKQRQHLTIE